MERVKLERMAIAVLVIIAFLVGVQTYRKTKGEKKSGSVEVKVSQLEPEAASLPPVVSKIQPPLTVEYTGANMRNPFKSNQ